jgi:integrase
MPVSLHGSLTERAMEAHRIVVPMPRRPRRAKLTEQVVEALQSGERCYDTDQPGFYAIRLARGVVFRCMADLPTRVRRERLGAPKTIHLAIGRFGTADDEFSAKAARVQARRLIGMIRAGQDPRRPTAAGGITLQSAWENYRDDYLVKRHARPKTLRAYKFAMDRLDQRWLDAPLAQIAGSPEAIKSEHDRLTLRNGPGAADASLQLVRTLHRHVTLTGLSLPPWPTRAYVAHGIKNRAQERQIPEKDLPAWRAKVDRIKDPLKRELMLFGLFSGLRNEDACTLRWEHLNVRDRRFHQPEPKGGERKKFDLPLSDEILRILWRARKAARNAGIADSPWVFPSMRTKSGHIANLHAQVDGEKIAGGHHLRHTITNIMKSAGVWESDAAVILNHKRDTETHNYHDPRSSWDHYVRVQNQISDHIVRALGR